jgi:hypothetical protein
MFFFMSLAYFFCSHRNLTIPPSLSSHIIFFVPSLLFFV